MAQNNNKRPWDREQNRSHGREPTNNRSYDARPPHPNSFPDQSSYPHDAGPGGPGGPRNMQGPYNSNRGRGRGYNNVYQNYHNNNRGHNNRDVNYGSRYAPMSNAMFPPTVQRSPLAPPNFSHRNDPGRYPSVQPPWVGPLPGLGNLPMSAHIPPQPVQPWDELPSLQSTSSRSSRRDHPPSNQGPDPPSPDKPAALKTPEKKKKKKKSKRSEEYTSKARTLGELALETVRMNPLASELEEEPASDEELKLEDEQPDFNAMEEERSYLDEVPRITAEDLENFKEKYNTDPEEFDMTTMHVEVRDTALPILDCSRFYVQNPNGSGVVSTNIHSCMLTTFEINVLGYLNRMREQQPTRERAPTPPFHKNCKCGHDSDAEDNSDQSSSEDEDDGTDINVDVNDDRELTDEQIGAMKERYRVAALMKREVQRKIHHPAALSPDICFNEPGLANDGPSCRCSLKAKQEGLRHNIYPGETKIPECITTESNSSSLHHYVLRAVRISEDRITGEKVKERDIGCGRTSSITHGGVIYDLEGFSVFFHQPLPELMPAMPISKWTQEFDFKFVKEPFPEAFTIRDLELFHTYLFDNILELYDYIDVRRPKGVTDGCPIYHIMPRYVTASRTAEKKLLPMSDVMQYLSNTFGPVVTHREAQNIATMTEDDFGRTWVMRNKGQLIMKPEKKPSAIRVDNFMRTHGQAYPDIVHYAMRPLVYSTLANKQLQKYQRKLVKMKRDRQANRHSEERNQELEFLKKEIERLKTESQKQRSTTFISSSEGFFKTGLNPDIVTHSMILILAVQHVRLHWSLAEFEERISYKFKNRALLELALTHPSNSNRNSFGTNYDHARNVLANCGTRRRVKQPNDKEKKKGIHNLLNIMSKSGEAKSTTSQSTIAHNERLEYLGDAVVEMIVTHRLFFLLPHHNEGGLATYRSSLVQNRNLASLAKKIGIHKWLMFAHGSELCHEADFKHALANAFEALMAAVYLDCNIHESDRLFSEAMWADDPRAKRRWEVLESHELKRGMASDRHMIAGVPALEKLTKFEEMTGMVFDHIRVLAKAFTRRNIPKNDLTNGNNQRLEWLGDTVLQLFVSDYLYRHFPNHHEGHLSLLRTCLVSNKTQAAICDELSIPEYIIRLPNKDNDMKLKDKADLVEALIGALFVDKGWDRPKTFVKVVFLPRLKHFIDENRWNDPKSHLQQSCLALRDLEPGPPEIPIYKMLSVRGPTNTRIYEVAVSFRGKRLAVGEGGNIHQAQMKAAEKALRDCAELFPDMKNRKRRHKRNQTGSYTPTPGSSKSLPSLLSMPPPPFPPYGVPSNIFTPPVYPISAPPPPPTYPPYRQYYP